MLTFPGRDFPPRDVDRLFNRLAKFRNRLREAVGLCVSSVTRWEFTDETMIRNLFCWIIAMLAARIIAC